MPLSACFVQSTSVGNTAFSGAAPRLEPHLPRSVDVQHLDRCARFGSPTADLRPLSSEHHEHRPILRQIERHARAAVSRRLPRDLRIDLAADRIPQFGLLAADAERALGPARTRDEVDVGRAVAAGACTRTALRSRAAGSSLSGSAASDGESAHNSSPSRNACVVARREPRRALRQAGPEHDRHPGLLEFHDLAQRRQRRTAPQPGRRPAGGSACRRAGRRRRP